MAMEVGGVLRPPPFSIAGFPKQNLRISPSKFSVSTFPKHNLRISPSKFDDRGSLFRYRCSSSESAEVGSGGMMYQGFKKLIAAINPPSLPKYYRITNLEMIIVPRNDDDKDFLEEAFKTFKDMCDLWLRIQVEEDEISEMLIGDLCRKIMLHVVAKSSLYLVDRCICSRSIVCFCYNKLSEQLPFLLGHPSLFYVGNNSEDTIDGFEFQLQISVDGSDESICIYKNLEHFLQHLMALKGKSYAVTVSHRSIKLDKKMITSKIDGVGNHSNLFYNKCI